MGKSFWNRDRIIGLAGLLAYAVATLILFIPFKGDATVSLVDWNSTLGVIVITFFVVSVGLYIYGIFKPERTLSYRDKKAIVEERQPILKELEEVIQQRLRVAKELSDIAVKLPLSQYWDKYLKHSWPAILYPKVAPKPIVIMNQLFKHGFIWNNIFFTWLKEENKRHKSLVNKVDFFCTQIRDNELEKRLTGLWKFEHTANSAQIYTNLSIKNKLPHSPTGLRGGLRGKRNTQVALNKQLEFVEERIQQLRGGDDL